MLVSRRFDGHRIALPYELHRQRFALPCELDEQQLIVLSHATTVDASEATCLDDGDVTRDQNESSNIGLLVCRDNNSKVQSHHGSLQSNECAIDHAGTDMPRSKQPRVRFIPPRQTRIIII
jgi:hypothetical protein